MRPIRFGPSLTYDRIQRGLIKLREQVRNTEQQAMNGIKQQRVSDDPIIWTEVHRLRQAASNQEGYKDNITRATSLLGTAEEALNQAGGLMKRAWETSVQMSSGSYNADDRIAAAIEIREIKQTLLNLSNTTLGDRRVFAGSAYDGAAFNEAGVYQGSTDTPEIRVSKDEWLQVGWDGSQVFQGGVDLFAKLDDLETALNANDVTSIQGLLPDMEAGVKQTVKWRAEIGAQWQKGEDALALSDRLTVFFNEQLATMVEVDPVETYSKLASLRTSYEAALRVSAQSMSQTLFDFMR